MSKSPSKYNWQRDAAIVFLVAVLVFYLDPVGRAHEADGRKDGGMLWILIIVSIVTMTAIVISLQHYWKWVAASTFCVATANQLHSHFVRYAGHYPHYTPMMHIKEFVINDLIYLAFALPVAALVYYNRKEDKE